MNKRKFIRGKWKSKPATEKQIRILKDRGLYEEGVTRGEATELIKWVKEEEKWGEEEL